jgi:hypothetical protein
MTWLFFAGVAGIGLLVALVALADRTTFGGGQHRLA